MSRRGRPSGSGYRSQIVLLWSLIAKGQLCFHEVVKETNIDENRVRPNLQILIEKGLVRKYRRGHKMMYEVSDKNQANRYLWDEFMRFAGEETKTQPSVSSAINTYTDSSSWKTLQEDVDFVVDRKMGVITFSKSPRTPVKVTYRAGYEKTPEPIRKASAVLVAGFLQWILALKSKKGNDIRLIPRKTWKQVKQLIEPFRKGIMDKEREILLREVTEHPHETYRLERSEGLELYRDYEKLLKWAKELRLIERLEATKSMTKGVRERRIGPKRQKHQEPI